MKYHKISHTQTARTVYRSVNISRAQSCDCLSVCLPFRQSVNLTIDRAKGFYHTSLSHALFFLSLVATKKLANEFVLQRI